MAFYYTDEKNHQILISLLKQYGIHYVVVSPGATNVSFVESVQCDSFFRVFSCVDERSAAYLACGMAEETGEIIVLSCTGATASRNYYPGLTEAYYRKLPVLAITSSQVIARVGNLTPQVTDRSQVSNDIAVYHTTLQCIHDSAQFSACVLECNRALVRLTKDGGGPVHINIETVYSRNYGVRHLPSVRRIQFFSYEDHFPEAISGRVAVTIGSHRKMSKELVAAIDRFCELYDGAVLCDHTSGYYGKYSILPAVIGAQEELHPSEFFPSLVIHMGEVSGDYDGNRLSKAPVWRISEDGALRDTFGSLCAVYEVSPLYFFRYYAGKKSSALTNTAYYDQLLKAERDTRALIPIDKLPLSNIFVAGRLSMQIPTGSHINFGILNSLRCWNMFRLPEGVSSSSNVGGFGIDGALSTTIGGAIANPDKLFFLVVGDLAFFYDMNALGNRHIGRNLRILLLNNGVGTEFKNYNHRAAEFGEAGDLYMAARGHFGHKSESLVRDFTEDLGLKYMTASSVEQLESVATDFLHPLDETVRQSMVLEIFTDSRDESEALCAAKHARSSAKGKLMARGTKLAEKTFGTALSHKLINFVKKHVFKG